MTLKYVTYCTKELLTCGFVPNADVILCVQDAALIVQPEPPCGIEITTLVATICKASTFEQGCQNFIYQYTFSYDDVQITDPGTRPLIESDIAGVFCQTCETDWVLQQISCAQGAAPCVEDSDSIDFSVTEDGCITGEVLISADADNQLSLHADGLYAASGGGGGNDWHITGNSDIVDGTNFLGTTNNVPVAVRTNNEEAGKFFPSDPSHSTAGHYATPDVILGSLDSTIDGDASGTGNVIIGGTNALPSNITATALNAAGNIILGGGANTIVDCSIASILGGAGNYMEFATGSTIVGGNNNFLQSIEPNGNLGSNFIAGDHNSITSSIVSASLSSILGGNSNSIEDSQQSVICGGVGNDISSTFNYWLNVIVGGDSNAISDCSHSFIGGGDTNSITTEDHSFIGGGEANSIHDGDHNVICGGGYTAMGQEIEGNNCFIGGGTHNRLINFAFNSSIVGGADCLIDTAASAFIGGGDSNQILASTNDAFGSFVGGGSDNIIDDTAAEASHACIVGGSHGTIKGNFSSIVGGHYLSLGANSFGYQADVSSVAARDLTAFNHIGFFGDVDLWIGNTDSTARKLKLFEANTDLDYSSANSFALVAQPMAADLIMHMPQTAGSSGDVLAVSSALGGDMYMAWATIPGAYITASADTNSIDLTVAAGSLTADAKISADAGNQVSIHADGLFVATGAGGGGMAIGGSVTSATTGSVLFINAGPILAQDNNNFFYDDTNNRLGLGTTTPKSSLDTAKSFGANIVTKVFGDSPYTATESDYTILCDCTGGAITVNLPAVSGIPRRIYNIKKIDSSGNAITIDGNSSETIDGATTKTISTQYQSYTIQCDGSAWYIL